MMRFGRYLINVIGFIVHQATGRAGTFVHLCHPPYPLDTKRFICFQHSGIEIAQELKRLKLDDEVSKEIIEKLRIVLNVISQMKKSLLRRMVQQG